MDPTITKLRVESILKHIDLIINDLEGISLEEFQQSDLHVRATCFSLMQISEQLTKLHTLYGEQYPNVPWNEAIKLRTLIVHIYNKVSAIQIYKIAKNDLKPLKEEILKIEIR